MFTANTGVLASRNKSSDFLGRLSEVPFSLTPISTTFRSDAIADIAPTLQAINDNSFHGSVIHDVSLQLNHVPGGVETPQTQYFTTAIYSLVVEEKLNIGQPEMPTGLMLSEAVDKLTIIAPKLKSGTLDVTVSYTEVNTLPDDLLTIAKPLLKSGTLLGAIVYQQYDPAVGDPLTITKPLLLSGTMTTSVHYVVYDPAPVDSITLTKPLLTSGTLT